LSDQGYLLHDHLEVENNPVYFYQFINMAGRHNLQYLADTSVSTMFTGNLPKETAGKLQGLSSLINIEQYMDFIRNRRFRRTLLCRKEQQIQRNIDTRDIENFYLSTPLKTTEVISEQQINSQAAIQFASGGLTFKLEEPLAKQAFVHLLHQHGKPLHFNDLCQYLQQKSQLELDAIKDYLCNKVYLTRLLFAGAINIHSDAGLATTMVTDPPITSGLARYQAALGTSVTNLRHQTVKLQDPDRLVLQHADGTKSARDLATLLAERIVAGEFKLELNSQEISDAGSVQQQCQLYLPQLMQRFAANGLLVHEE
jgi:methyltransferase-like protein